MADSEFVTQGNLFTRDFLAEAITKTPEWAAITDAELAAFGAALTTVFEAFPRSKNPNEAQTEDDLIWKVLDRLGWVEFLRQQNLAARGRDDVPDGLMFENAAIKAQANAHHEEWRRYGLGLAVVESKRWGRPLDRRITGRRSPEEQAAPSTQMLRYLRRVEDLTGGKLRWGVLTNGGKWRLYWQGAKSVSEDFFEIDLAAVLGLSDQLFTVMDDAEKRHWLQVFLLIFGRAAFIPAGPSAKTFHEKALDQGRFYEERVAANLSTVVYGQVFPNLAKAIGAAAPDASLDEVRNAALILLYRLLFLLYAEDRDLLPVKEKRYQAYSLRVKVRNDVGKRKDEGDTFSATASRYWAVIEDLTRAIDQGDTAIGLPPYNGGLFDAARTPLLTKIRIGDAVMAEVIDVLSFYKADGERRYINYRDLSVQQLGSIYEQLLEQEIIKEDGITIIRPNIFARKNSGSYYTPDDLVRLIIKETLEPLISERDKAFHDKVAELAQSDRPVDRRLALLDQLDPAARLLDLKVCDPAMGSGHFLVSLVDFLADQVIAAMAEAETAVEWGDYVSPLAERIANIRRTILANAEKNGWTVEIDQLDDRHIIRRMVLKRCVYGVDKNIMAVELAKVSLWLHTFTVGAPLSFLDHHLRVGDSLFGSWVSKTMENVTRRKGKAMLLYQSVTEAMGSAAAMRVIEGLTDAEIAEAKNSADIFAGIRIKTAPLDRFMAFLHALDWLDYKGKANQIAIQSWLDGVFGDPVDIALGKIAPKSRQAADTKCFTEILQESQDLVKEQGFLNWQVSFPGVWEDWQTEPRTGGFDAVIGNPPWDKIKLQQVEWFAARKPEIASLQRASDRKKAVEKLKKAKDPIAADFDKAENRADGAIRMARSTGDYPLLSGGDINLYSLFVERSKALVRQNGMVGLLTPIGIATDKTSSKFFSGMVKSKALKALYAFENRGGWLFKDIHHEEQPTAMMFASGDAVCDEFDFCVRVASWDQFNDPERRFHISADDLRRINPNTGTAPMFRTRRDADLTTAIYNRLPILVDDSSGTEKKAWRVKYSTNLHMSNQSEFFETKKDVQDKFGAYPVGGNIFKSKDGYWLPLYEGKMIQIYNHRYASVRVNPKNVSSQGVTEQLTIDQLHDPSTLPDPRFWFMVKDPMESQAEKWRVGFNDICNTNNSRSLIASIVPAYAYGNTLPTFQQDDVNHREPSELLSANFCSIICDYLARQKIQSRHLNKYIVEQLPVIPPSIYKETKFGKKTAAAIVRQAVLELTYTAHDMAPFAIDMGYVDKTGKVKPPFAWDEARRLKLKAKIDAVYFLLYGVTDRDDVRYIYSTFPLVQKEEMDTHKRYLSQDLCLAWMNALLAGDPDADIKI